LLRGIVKYNVISNILASGKKYKAGDVLITRKGDSIIPFIPKLIQDGFLTIAEDSKKEEK
jgi:hypothetical protein